MQLHHQNDVNACPLCEQKLTIAHPYLVNWFRTKKQAYPTLHISWAYRDPADQELAFQDGKTQLHFPNSAHNKVPSLALDLFSLTEDGIAAFPYPLYKKISDENKADRLSLIWGGDFKSIGDSDHFQVDLPLAPDPDLS